MLRKTFAKKFYLSFSFAMVKVRWNDPGLKSIGVLLKVKGEGVESRNK